jgi:hypothetical protein
MLEEEKLIHLIHASADSYLFIFSQKIKPDLLVKRYIHKSQRSKYICVICNLYFEVMNAIIFYQVISCICGLKGSDIRNCQDEGTIQAGQ